MASLPTHPDSNDMLKEKDWPAYLGMLDWDSTNIVFTKRSLIEFLKYTGITVDPNFANISKLPRYATFSNIPENTLDLPTAISPSSASISLSDNAPNDFKPSRRVRAVPGGPHSDIFGGNDDEGGALSLAPPKEISQIIPTAIAELKTSTTNESDNDFKPSRRVRTTPGGPSSMANLWDPAEPEEFKPTRRVRQGPGGQDNLSGIL